MKHFDVAKVSKDECGIDALEYSAQFFMDKAEDMEYLRELKKRAADNGVKRCANHGRQPRQHWRSQ